jgi:hypothetical protein
VDSAVVLPADVAEFVQSGVSITVASRDDRLVPSIAKAVACRVEPARDQVVVFVFSNTAEALLRDVASHGRLAVAFSRPTTNRTLQLKGRDVALVPTRAADVALVRRQLALFADDLRRLGWDADFVESVFWHDPENLVALSFRPEGAFHQTPGPGAGQALPLQRGGSA